MNQDTNPLIHMDFTALIAFGLNCVRLIFFVVSFLTIIFDIRKLVRRSQDELPLFL